MKAGGKHLRNLALGGEEQFSNSQRGRQSSTRCSHVLFAYYNIKLLLYLRDIRFMAMKLEGNYV
jgi:hypothetical protein